MTTVPDTPIPGTPLLEVEHLTLSRIHKVLTLCAVTCVDHWMWWMWNGPRRMSVVPGLESEPTAVNVLCTLGPARWIPIWPCGAKTLGHRKVTSCHRTRQRFECASDPRVVDLC